MASRFNSEKRVAKNAFRIDHPPLEMEPPSDWDKGHHSYHGKGTADREDSRVLCWAQPRKSPRESSETPGQIESGGQDI